MTVKLVVLYTQPDDAATFDEHYLSVHAPLVAEIPGLERFESGRFTAAADGADLVYHRTAELYFSDMEALGAALGSSEGQATAADFGQIAPAGSRMFIAELD